MALFQNLFGGQQPGMQPAAPPLPRVPWAQNPMVTTAALSLLGGRNLNDGLANVAATAGQGMAAKTGMQQFMLAQQEAQAKKAEQEQRRAQMNEVMKAWPGLSPEQRALFSAQPELFGQYAMGTMTPEKPMVVGADSQIYNPTTGEWTAPPGGGPQKRPDFGDVTGFRKEIQALPSYKNVAQAAPIYKAMVATYPNKTRASDLNLVYGLGKIFDPGSVVREGEMVLVQDTAALPDWLIGQINRLNGGQALQEGTRQAILTEAKTRMDAYAQQWEQDANQYKGIAERYGIPIEDAIPDFGPLPGMPPNGGGGPRVAPPQQSVPPGVPVDWRTYFGGQ